MVAIAINFRESDPRCVKIAVTLLMSVRAGPVQKPILIYYYFIAISLLSE
jgi:hypothetical protein